MSDQRRRIADRTLVIGWDGVDAELVDELCRDGRLPALQSLRECGSTTLLKGLTGLGDDAHWSTFATGESPGVHGRFHFLQRRTGSYDFEMVRRDAISPARPFWSRLATAGMRVSTLDVPKAPLAHERGVREVADWMPHGADSDTAVASGAGDIEQWNQRRPHGSLPECHEAGDEVNSTQLIAKWDDCRRARTTALHEWINEETDDLIVAVYAEGHCAGHHFAHLHEPATADDVRRHTEIGDPMVRQIEALDGELAATIEVWGGHSRIAVFSPTGMTTTLNAGRAVNATVAALNNWWLLHNPKLAAISVAKRAKWRLLRRHQGAVPSAEAFSVVPSLGRSTAIRLNVRGREPAGIVSTAGSERLLAWLTKRLEELVDENGKRIVSEVFRTRTAHPGPLHDSHSDLVAVWASHEPHTAVTSVTRKSFERETSGASQRAGHNGDHRPGGWLVAGPALNLSVEEPKVQDLARIISTWTVTAREEPSAPETQLAEMDPPEMEYVR
ncbi:MAG: putative AlkP superfamily phosphohydrolase/phosphomutase [Candidatus Poriferisodalaceae bacterium]|jgi:predicted AlkP superfamily phosphohydrolase/phosphomutase